MHLLRSPNPDIILEGPVDHSQKMEGGESGQSHFVDPQSTQEGADDLIVRLRGLPYSAKRLDVLELLKDCDIVNKENGITFTYTEEGRPTGEAFVDLASEEDVAKALEHNNEHMGRRYVEIFRATRGEKEWDLRVSSESNEGRGGSRDGGENVVRLRGLPFGATDEQVNNFFSGLAIVPGGIVVQRDESGKETGIGFVEFLTEEDAEKALERDRKSMGHRYIEVFRSTVSEIKPVKSSRPTPYDRPRSGREFGGYGGYGSGGGGYRNERSFTRGRGRGGRGGYGHYDDFYDNYREEPFYEDSGYGGYNGGGGSFDPSYHQPPRGGGGMVSYPPIRHSQQHVSGGDNGQYGIRMRGLPYSAKDGDVRDFFAPHVPVKIQMDLDDYGRPSGEGIVKFATPHDAKLAMQKNKNSIGHRYIELFPLFNDEPGPPSHQSSWSDPRHQGPPPVESGPPGGGVSYPPPKSQYHHHPPPQQAGGYGSGPPPAGYQGAPPTTWAGVGY